MVVALVNLPQGSVLGTYRLKDLKIEGTDNREALFNVTRSPQALFNDTRSPQALFNVTRNWRSPQVCMIEGNTAETGLFYSESRVADSGELTWQYSVVETSVLSVEMPARIF
jgi:hypothetical protein